MPPAYQAVQSTHAAVDFVFQHKEEAEQWHDLSNSIVLLSVADERKLFDLIKELNKQNIKHTAFREPDVGYSITAVALEPGEKTSKFVEKMPTALKAPYNGGFKEEQIDYLDKQLRKYKTVINDMNQCFQYGNVSVLNHGKAVWERFIDLKGYLEGKPTTLQWVMPKWVEENKDLLLSNLLDDYTIERYIILHDCGKPYCLTTDEDGKRHFLDHGNVSYKTYMTKLGGDEQIGKLIKQDMDIHCLKPEGVVEFASRKEAATLLLAGLSEIHANAEMFGGFNSDSFKIKWKRLNSRGKNICAALKETARLWDLEQI